jgi:phytoene dehydrogenase-like protein
MSLLLGMLWLAQAPPPPADPTDEVQKVLNQVKQEALRRETVDRAAALDLLEKAERAKREGKREQARTLARQAQEFFPESLIIANWLTQFEAEAQPAPLQQRVHQRLALASINEANAHIESLLENNQRELAQQWIDTILAAAGRFQPSEELSLILARTRQLQQRLQAGAAPAPAEPAPPPPPAAKVLLTKKMDANWVQLPAVEALQQIADATGVTFTVDPDVSRIRILESTPLTVTVRDFPAERLLRVLTETTLTEAVLLDQGQVVITTKPKALALAVQQRREGAAAPRGGAVTSRILPAEQVRGEKAKAPPTPPHLQSPQAFVRHLDELLTAPAAIPPEPAKDRILPPE